MSTTHLQLGASRGAELRRALFCGDDLHLGNPNYLAAAKAILGELLRSDTGSGDLTATALGLSSDRATGRLIAKEDGVLAGLAEYVWLLSDSGISITPQKTDGDALQRGDTILLLEGDRQKLLAYERVGLNLLQRMSGISTITRQLGDVAKRRSPETHVVATRKTQWGLLDKRAVHLGGGGTHRIGLSDAILVKNNHLALISADESVAAVEAIRRIWPWRDRSRFLEVEVRSRDSALAAAREFRARQAGEPSKSAADCPCLLMLDNFTPAQIIETLALLRREELLDHVLIEASGNISADNLEAYAAAGVDAISIGALTHSPRVLDISQKLS